MAASASRAEPDPEVAARAAHLCRLIEQEYETLWRRVAALVYRMCGPLRRDEVRDRVQEVLNETVRRALQAADRFDTSRSASAWLMGIAVHVIQDQLRGRKKKTVVVSQMPAERWQQVLEQLSEASDEKAVSIRLDVRQALSRLDPRARRVIEARFFEGLDGEELARAVDAPTVGAARVRLTRALQALRGQLLPGKGEVKP
jgi:RNA polymerase sigma-70 factor (ECF subfamily)